MSGPVPLEVAARRAAAFARLAPDDARAAALGADLAAELARLAPLRDVRPGAAGGAIGVGAGGMPLRADAGPPYALARPLRDIAPGTRAGFVVLPRIGAATAAGGRPFGDGAAASSVWVDDALAADALAAELELGA